MLIVIAYALAAMLPVSIFLMIGSLIDEYFREKRDRENY